jgi:tRNA 5-methylaminomethyl-2-thiouridine biosynthesis bifunctional protein
MPHQQSMPKAERVESALIWEDDDQPRSRLYDDVYFSRADGLAETRAVFLAACELPGAWRERHHFTVGELGFGTGLNIAALLTLWRQTRPPGGRLSIFSIEAHPMTADEASRALRAWPEIADAAHLLTSRWPGRSRGFHRVDLPELGVALDVAIMDAADALGAWSGSADAWFLDGFAPARNPAMWSAEVLRLVGERSAPGAHVATYSVAGHVRRDLAAAGFSVERRPGFAAKRQRLEARFPGPAPRRRPVPRAAVIGAGIAGASVARALRALGVEATVFDALGGGAGASGAPAALVTPRLDAGLAAPATLFAQAFRRAGTLYAALPGAVIASRAIQLEATARDVGRFAAIAASDLFEPEGMRGLDAAETTLVLGETAPAGLMIDDAMVVDPATVLAAWLGEVAPARVAAVSPQGGVWRLSDGEGRSLAEAETVFLCAGMANSHFAPRLALSPVRGQATWARGVSPAISCLFGGYAIPTRDGVLFGATHDRDDLGEDPREADHARNRAALTATLPILAARLDGVPVEAHAGVRAATADYLPLAGAVPGMPEGLFTLTGLGSRGFTLAPLLAEHLAALVIGAPSPMPRDLATLVDPDRFERRAARRGRPLAR